MKDLDFLIYDRVACMVAAVTTMSVKAAGYLLRAIAVFLAMNDKVGYAMRDDDDK